MKSHSRRLIGQQFRFLVYGLLKIAASLRCGPTVVKTSATLLPECIYEKFKPLKWISFSYTGFRQVLLRQKFVVPIKLWIPKMHKIYIYIWKKILYCIISYISNLTMGQTHFELKSDHISYDEITFILNNLNVKLMDLV